MCSTLPEIPVIFIILLLIFFGVIIISYVLMWLLMDLCDIILHVLYFYVWLFSIVCSLFYESLETEYLIFFIFFIKTLKELRSRHYFYVLPALFLWPWFQTLLDSSQFWGSRAMSPHRAQAWAAVAFWLHLLHSFILISLVNEQT